MTSPLITITTDEQGSSVVSARELHEFLGVKARFNDWIKRRIIKYGLQEGVDYVEVGGAVTGSKGEEGVLLKSEYNPGGRPETDYGLPLDVAKELCMVENNEKGREARRYFIEAEKALQQVIKQPAPDPLRLLAQLLQQQTQLLTEQGRRLDALEQRLSTPEASYVLLDVPVPMSPPRPPTPPHLRGPASLRQSINHRINAYCERWQASQGETYGYLYRRLHEVYGVNVYQLIRKGKESMLDAVERYGHLERLDSLVTAELDCHQP